MKRRDVLTTTAAIAFAGCLGGGGNGSGGNTGNGSETTDGSPTGATETPTSATSVPTATDAGTSTPHTAQTTEPGTSAKTNTATPTDTIPPTETATGTTDTPIPIPDRPTDHRKDTPLTGEARVVFKDGGSRIVVSGTIVGKNGCQKPVLDSVRETKSGLVITIATKRDASADALCTMALVELDYRYTVTVETPPKSVTVIHHGATGKQTITTVKPGN